MAVTRDFPRIPLHGYDVRYYVEKLSNSMLAEIHCYRWLPVGSTYECDLVLRMCFYEKSGSMPANELAAKPVTLHYPIERFRDIFTIVQSGAPLELYQEDKAWRLHGNTVGWVHPSPLPDTSKATAHTND